MQAASTLIDRFVTYIINPIILLVFAAGFFLFIWGLVQFLMALSDDARGQRHEAGKQHMLWGLVGMVIMVSVYGIIALIDNTFNLQISNPDINRINNIGNGGSFF